MAQDRITLGVPARSEFAKIVRMTAAALGSRLGMSFDDVEDLRMAAEEAFVYAVDTLGGDDEVVLAFLTSPESIEIEVGLGGAVRAGDEDAERRATYATFILQSVCDRFVLASDENGAHLRLTKLVGDPDAH